MHESIYAAVRSWTFQSLANIDPVLYYGGVALCCSETSFVSLPENIASLPEDQAQLKSCIGQEQNREGSGFQLVIKLKKIDPHTKKLTLPRGTQWGFCISPQKGSIQDFRLTRDPLPLDVQRLLLPQQVLRRQAAQPLARYAATFRGRAFLRWSCRHCRADGLLRRASTPAL